MAKPSEYKESRAILRSAVAPKKACARRISGHYRSMNGCWKEYLDWPRPWVPRASYLQSFVLCESSQSYPFLATGFLSPCMILFATFVQHATAGATGRSLTHQLF